MSHYSLFNNIEKKSALKLFFYLFTKLIYNLSDETQH